MAFMLGSGFSLGSSKTKEGDSKEKKPVSVQPHELTSQARLPKRQRLLGRVVCVEEQETLFTCYLVCGPTRKQLIQVEAWQTLKQRAAELLQEGELVSLTNVALTLRKPEKMKYCYSGVQYLVRFDNRIEVESAVQEAQRAVSGFPDMLVKDLCHNIPLTSFSAAACLREGTVRIKGLVRDANRVGGKNATECGKAFLEERENDGTRAQAELLGFGEHCNCVADLEKEQMYEFEGLAIQASTDKNGFAFKWVKGSTKKKTELASTTASATFSGEVKMLSKSSYTKSGGYADARAILVAASTLDSIVPNSGSHKFENDVVWEIPWVMVTDISRRGFEAWHYTGCSECFKASCEQHSGQTRNCYAVELQFVDHTSLLEAKMFTQVADELFREAGVDPPGSLTADHEQDVLRTLKDMNFAIRLAIREDEGYQNRPARNNLQVVRIRKQDAKWTGTAKPLLRIPTTQQKFGIPAMFVKEVEVDAADQLKGPGNVLLDCVELLVRIGDKKPQNQQQDDEAGLRVTVEASDHGDEHSDPFFLMWVVSIEALLDLARDLLPKSIFRIIARPVVMGGKIVAWQVLDHSAKVDVEAWLARLQWQRTDLDQKTGKKRPPLEAFADKTPNSKVKALKDALASPSYTAPK
eukprot:symbB.v1.2.034677.t1/scaffold4517.1/size38588/1